MPSPIEKSRFSDAIYHSSFCFLLQVQCLQVDSNVRNLRKFLYPAVTLLFVVVCISYALWGSILFCIFVRKSMILEFREIRTNLF